MGSHEDNGGPGGWRHWFHRRSVGYIARRIIKLVSRYGITSRKAKQRTHDLVRLLSRYGCAPTLATPGFVIDRNRSFIRRLAEDGVDIAFHGYDHVDFSGLSREQSHRQVDRAVQAFNDAGIAIGGFRCPYLSYSHDMDGYMPHGLFSYSSNEALWWDVSDGAQGGAMFDQLSTFYAATPAKDALILPRRVGDLIEIPVSLPDDLQLFDGLGSRVDRVGRSWVELLDRVHRDAGVFALLMHPETFWDLAAAYEALLESAHRRTPAVWLATLQDVAVWWRELESFGVVRADASLRLRCSERGMVLERVDGEGSAVAPGYRAIESREVAVTGNELPLLGVERGAPDARIARLRELGYLVADPADAARCTVRIESSLIETATDRELVAHIEGTPGRLVRFWHWPDGVRSALCFTGDLDALSLGDYARRLVTLRG